MFDLFTTKNEKYIPTKNMLSWQEDIFLKNHFSPFLL
jgi:hypothetical protein